ncbi:MAG: hypothetical protein WA231_10685 [Methylocella sp.]
MPGLEISIITAKFKTKAEEPQISRFFSKLLEHGLEFDFRFGDEPYKESWANERGILASFSRPLTVKGAVLVLLLLARQRRRHLAGRLARRLPAPGKSRIKTALTNLIRKSAV